MGLFTSLLFGAIVFIVKAAPEPLNTALAENASKQTIARLPPRASPSSYPSGVANIIGTTKSQSCDTYHFHKQFIDLGAGDNQLIANTTAPAAGSPIESESKTLSLLDVEEEITRFYTDPVFTTDFVLTDDIEGNIWLQTTDFVNTHFTVKIFDYDPADSSSTLLGNNQFQVITDGQIQVNLHITSPSITIPAGHRFLFILYGRSPLFSTPTVTLFYDSVTRDSRFNVCQITPAKLTINKNAPAATVAGQPITYTLTVSNSGSLTATNLIISDTVPTNATYVSGGTQIGNVVTWSVSSLGANRSIETAFVVTATETITNSDYHVIADANISAIGQDDVVTVVSQPGQPNLTISKSGPTIVDSGDPITYTLTVANSGDTSALNLVISDTIPPGATYISGGTKSGNIVTWSAFSLSAKASLDFYFVVTATSAITNENYQVIADGGNMAFGDKSITTTIVTKLLPLYLPIVLNMSPSPQTTLMVQSENTGGINPIRILDPDNNNSEVLSCTIGNNVTQLCGTFPPIDNYTIVAHTANCGVLQGTFNDATAGATITRRVRCS